MSTKPYPHADGELSRAIGGISDRVLSDRLAGLTEAGLMHPTDPQHTGHG